MNKKVLVVDTSKTIRKQLAYLLAKAGWDILEADNGKTGYETLKYNPETSVVISEIDMPMVDGVDMMQMISDDEKKMKSIPLIVLTAQGAENQRKEIKSLYEGLEGWLSKPVNSDDLIEMISKFA